jgi:hypothetical protein
MNTKLPLETLMLRLQQEGFQVDPATQLRIQQVLHQLGNQYRNDPAGLVRILCPLVANTDEEQERFQQVFQLYLDQYLKKDLVAEAETEWESINHKVKKRRYWAYPAGALMLIVLLWSLSRVVLYDPLDSVSQEQTEAAGEMEEESPQTQPVQISGNNSPSALPKLSPQFSISPPYPRVGQTLQLQLLDHPGAELTEVQWTVAPSEADPTQFHGPIVNLEPEQTGIMELSVWIQYKGQPLTRQTLTRSIPVYPAGLTVQERHAAETQALQQKQTRIKIMVFGLALLMIFFLEAYLHYFKSRMLRLAFQREFRENEEGGLQLPYDDRHIELHPEPAFFELADSMRQRQHGDQLVLDIPKTLYSTVRSGGLPSLQYSSRKVSTEYLVLIDESEPTRQAAELFKQLVSLLQKEEVLIESWHFRNDPRQLWQKDQLNTTDLDTLARLHPKDRLIIFSRGSLLVHPTENRLQDWVSQAFVRWEDRILLTTHPVSLWSQREEALQLCFQVLPADMEGQLGMIEAIQSGGISVSEQIATQKLVQKRLSPALQNQALDSPEALEDYLGESLYEWVVAASVASKLKWDMILKIGQSLAENQSEQQEEVLLSYDNLLKLSRIPWLQEGTMPSGLQKQLYGQLDQETEKLARQAVLEVLQKAQEQQGYQQESQVQQTVQKAALAPEDKQLQSKMRFLFQEGLLERFAGESWQQHFQPGWMIQLGSFRLFQYGLLALLISSLSIYGVNQWRYYQTEAILERHAPDAETLALFEDLDQLLPAESEALQEWKSSWESLNAGEIAETQNQLQNILRKPRHPYFLEAANLYRDLVNPWRSWVGN